MHNEISQFINTKFKAYETNEAVCDLKKALLADLNERYDDLILLGADEKTALKETIDSIGDLDEILSDMSGTDHLCEHNLTSFKASTLEHSDFANISLHHGKFLSSLLQSTDFSNSDLTGSIFKTSDLQHTKFKHTNLTDCNFIISNLKNTNFDNAILKRTIFNKSCMDGSIFNHITFEDVCFSMIDLRKVEFIDCTIIKGNFKYADLRNQCLNHILIKDTQLGQAILNDVSFQHATFKNVSFKPMLALTNKYYKALKTITFSDVYMDKLTYHSLKSMGADVTGITIF